MRTITVTIEFPALDNLVSYLRENEQARIDAATAQVKKLTAVLEKSQTELKASEAPTTT